MTIIFPHFNCVPRTIKENNLSINFLAYGNFKGHDDKNLRDFREEKRQFTDKLQCTLITGHSTEQPKVYQQKF